jgi:hypothetical protein
MRGPSRNQMMRSALLRQAAREDHLVMTRKTCERIGWAMLVFVAALTSHGQAPPEAAADFTRYTAAVETRLAEERGSNQTPLASVDRERLRNGEVVIEKLVPAQDADPPGAMMHHWRGAAFAPGATAADFDRLMRDFPSYTTVYAPQVVRAAIASHDGDHYGVTMRVKQKHVLTVVMDTAYDVTFAPRRPGRGWSTSQSTAITEIEYAGTDKERVLGPNEDHGFLWRLNTYWTYKERDGGLYLQLESVSLTRAIPAGLGWVTRPFVESVPSESLEFTLRKTCEALRKQPAAKGEGR